MKKEIEISKLTTYYLHLEEDALKRLIVKEYNKELIELEAYEIESINNTLYLTNFSNPAYNIHNEITDSLISQFVRHSVPESLQDVLLGLFNVNKTTLGKFIGDVRCFPEILETFHTHYLNTEFSIIDGILKRRKSKHHLKESGAVYTLKKIAREIVENTLEKYVLDNSHIDEVTCLDFASGTGRFYFEALEILTTKYGLSVQKCICNNLYAIDVDEVAIKILRMKAIALLTETTEESINSIFNNILVRNALIPKNALLYGSGDGIDLLLDFPWITKQGGFDIIFSNPPYYLLKINKKANQPQLSTYYKALQSKLDKELRFFKTSGIYNYSIEGMLNYYQLSIEMIIKLTKVKGHIGIICPSTLFADLTSSKLRRFILNAHKLYFIRFYPESALLFENVAQSTAIFYLQKNGVTDDIRIEAGDDIFDISKDLIKKSFPLNVEIPPIDALGWRILEKLSVFRRLKDHPFIRNKRGELDLTLFKTNITSTNTGWRLVRGNMISNGAIVDKNDEFVEIDSFLEKKSKDYINNDFNKKRLICQQISNIDSQNRLKFTYCEPNDILGNSCNYLVSTRDENDLYKLHFLLNSKLLNWRFKVSSSNNHINNYELDELPIINLDNFPEKEMDIDYDMFVCELFGLSIEETNYITQKSKPSKKHEKTFQPCIS